MLHFVWGVQSTISMVLGIVLFAMEIFAFIEAVRPRAEAYVAAGKLTKPMWCGITAVCVVVGFLTIFNPVSILGVLAVVGSAIFLADVRPALRKMLGHSSQNHPFNRW